MALADKWFNVELVNESHSEQINLNEPSTKSFNYIYDAISGLCGDDQQRIAIEGLRWLELILRKNSDYGSSVWQSPCLAPTMPVASAILVRMSDKVKRLASLAEKPAAVADESLDDTMRDLGAYALLYLARPK
jgi:hypothetical protein